MVKKVPAQFEASDGREFATEEEAKRHEALIEAKRAYDHHRTQYARVLWESQTTADGERFEMTMLRDYWYIHNSFYALPTLARVSFYIHHCDLDDGDEATIVHTDDSTNYGRIRIKDLYYHERNARKALLEISRQRLSELTKQVDQLEGEVATTEKTGSK